MLVLVWVFLLIFQCTPLGILADESILPWEKQDEQASMSAAAAIQKSLEMARFDVLGSFPHFEQGRRRLDELPDEICGLYNEVMMGLMECECDLVDEVDIQVVCSYVEEQCPDPSYCYDGTITTMINGTFQPVLNESRPILSTETCTYRRGLGKKENTCIQVIPLNEGSFEQIASCSATFNGKSCNYCEPCTGGGDNNETSSPTIAIDCCNRRTDTIQTCESGNGVVQSLAGITLPNYDTISGEAEGQCKGSYAYGEESVGSGASMRLSWSAVTMWSTLLLVSLAF